MSIVVSVGELVGGTCSQQSLRSIQGYCKWESYYYLIYLFK